MRTWTFCTAILLIFSQTASKPVEKLLQTDDGEPELEIKGCDGLRLIPEQDEDLEHNKNGRKLIAPPSHKYFWPDGRIPWRFDDDNGSPLPDDTYREAWLTAIELYENETCLTFPEADPTEQFYLNVTHDEGCYSYLGRLPLEYQPQPLSLGPHCHYVPVALHEAGHALGLYHEHSRSDRDQHIRIIWENIDKNRTNQFVKKRSFNFAPYDLDSIMHYGPFAFSKNDEPTMESLKPELSFLMGLNLFSSLTFYDLKSVDSAYLCAKPCGPTRRLCYNDGYLKKDCTCRCVFGFVGQRCEFIDMQTFEPVCSDIVRVQHEHSTRKFEYKGTKMACLQMFIVSPGAELEITVVDVTTSHPNNTRIQFRNNLPAQRSVTHILDTSLVGTVFKSNQSSLPMLMAIINGSVTLTLDIVLKKVRDVEIQIGRVESFEADDLFDKFYQAGDRQWRRIEHATAHQGSHFIYAFGDSDYQQFRDAAILVTKQEFDYRQEWCLSFFYIILGDEGEELRVQLRAGQNNDVSSVNEIWTITGHQKTWVKFSLLLPSKEFGDFHIAFVAVRGISNASVIAIDDLLIEQDKLDCPRYVPTDVPTENPITETPPAETEDESTTGETEEDSTPDDTSPDGSTPDGSTPDGSTPDGSTPDGSTPDGSTPDGSTPDGSTPDGSTQDKTTPGGPTPDRTTPAETTPDRTTPADTTPADTTVDDTTVDNTTPADTTNDDTTPDGTTVDDTTPVDTTVDDTTPADTTVDDTTVDNMTPADTTVDETTNDDTTVGDTTNDDTTVGDTTVDDTTVDDTTVDDTTVDDTTVDDTTVDDTTAVDTTPHDTTIADTTQTDTTIGDTTQTDESETTTEPVTDEQNTTTTEPLTDGPNTTATDPVTDETEEDTTTTDPITDEQGTTTTDPVTDEQDTATTDPITDEQDTTTTETVSAGPDTTVTDPVTDDPDTTTEPVTDEQYTTTTESVTDGPNTTVTDPATDESDTTPTDPITDGPDTTTAEPVTDELDSTTEPPTTTTEEPTTTSERPPVKILLDEDFEDPNIRRYFFIINENRYAFWRRHRDATDSLDTGPSHANSGSYYVYFEASYPVKPHDWTSFISWTKFTGQTCLKFYYHMYGYKMGSLEVSAIPEGKSRVLLWSKKGDQGDQWHYAQVTFDDSSYGLYHIEFRAIRGYTYTGDIALDDIRLCSGTCTSIEPPRKTLFREDFELGFTDTRVYEKGLPWKRRAGETPSTSTGPLTSNGKYAYVEASEPNNPFQVATLIMRGTVTVNATVCVSFRYNMRGDETTGTLELYIETVSLTKTVFTVTGDQGKDWKDGYVVIPAQKDQYQLLFVATTGTSYRSDICLDDILVEICDEP